MQDAADAMLDITESPEGRSAVHRDTISEEELRTIAGKRGIPFIQIEDNLLMKQPHAGFY
jgi:hypothetical protein